MRLPTFKPFRKGFCTCLQKYSLNTYVGRCAHRCIYCYAVKFPSFVGTPKPRLRFLSEIEGMAKNTTPRLPVMISDCTDPYQPQERRFEVTRKCVETLARHRFPILVVTKSDLVTRDIDLFKKTPTVISISITTLRDEVAEFIDPFAPLPERRLSALQKLAAHGVTTVARIDPLIPMVNSDEKELQRLVAELSCAGVKQVTAATMKPVQGFFRAVKSVNLALGERLEKIYGEGEFIAGYRYLRQDLRWEVMRKLHDMVEGRGMKFACCREGFNGLNTALCDGTQYLRKTLDDRL